MDQSKRGKVGKRRTPRPKGYSLDAWRRYLTKNRQRAEGGKFVSTKANAEAKAEVQTVSATPAI